MDFGGNDYLLQMKFVDREKWETGIDITLEQ